MKKKVKLEVKKPEVKSESPRIDDTIIEITDRGAIAGLEKQGYVVTGVQGEIKGLRPKTWILRKEK